MIKAIAIDDEPLALKVIEGFCERSGEIQLVKTFTKPKEGLKYLNSFPVDLVFLDIQMPSLTGTELAKEIKQDVMIIFTTAFDNFAVEGFNLNAADYLLKPFFFERFMQSVEKIKKMRPLQDSVSDHKPTYITVRADYSLIKIELEKINYIEGLDDYIKIHVQDAKAIVTRSTMKAILENLPPNLFVRIHRSFIVQKSKVTAIKNKTVFIQSVQIPVGVSYESNIEGLL